MEIAPIIEERDQGRWTAATLGELDGIPQGDLLQGRENQTKGGIRQHEMAWHRTAAYLWATGITQGQVAKIVEKSEDSVSALVKTPWFQQNVTRILKENGAKDVMKLFEAEQFNSLLTLINLRDDAKVAASVRRNAAVDILDRFLGKPTQRVETLAVPTFSDPVAEVERLEQENARLRPGSL